MGDRTGISWTDATWNPTRGCSRVSAGCVHCYAEGVAKRFSGPGLPYQGLVDRHGHWNGRIVLVEKMLDQPIRWRKPRRIFVNSMSDLFHSALHDEDIDQVFASVAVAGLQPFSARHTFQILTKRADRAREYLSQDRRVEWARAARRWVGDPGFDQIAAGPKVLPHVWLGVSVEDQRAADERIPDLLETPAAIRFLSCEPLLGPVRVDDIPDGAGGTLKPLVGLHWVPTGRGMVLRPASVGPRIHWVIVGSESGRGARLTDLEPFRSLRDQCAAPGTALFVKQLPIDGKTTADLDRFPEDLRQREFPREVSHV